MATAPTLAYDFGVECDEYTKNINEKKLQHSFYMMKVYKHLE